MGTPVGHLTAGKVTPTHPAHPRLVERAVGGLVEPLIPIQPRRHGFRGGRRRGGCGGVLVVDGPHLEEPAEAAVPHELAGEPVDRHRPLLRAHLEHAAVLSHGADERPPLLNVERERFLRVDILARHAGFDAGEHPLKLTRAHDHGVDVLVVEHAAIVLVDGPVRRPLGLVFLGPRQVAVAQGDDFRTLGKLVEQEPGPIADADGPHPDFVRRGRFRRQAPSPRQGGRRGGRGRDGQEPATFMRTNTGTHGVFFQCVVRMWFRAKVTRGKDSPADRADANAADGFIGGHGDRLQWRRRMMQAGEPVGKIGIHAQPGNPR